MFYSVEFSEEEIDFCVEMGVRRNEAKRNQTVSRGWPPRVKHIMGVYAEYACQKYLNATMDWEVYGKRGDSSRPDGILPDGRSLVVKSVGRSDLGGIWIPKVCLDAAGSSDVVVAFQVIPVEQSFSTYFYGSLGFLGWKSVENFLEQGKENRKHYDAQESLPGRKLSRDICWVLEKSRLNAVEMLLGELGLLK